MAKTRQVYRNNPYRVSGSAAYKPDFDGTAVRVGQPQPRPQVQPRRRVVQRPRVQVRPAGAVSLLAVVGFAAVAVCAALLLISNAQLMMINDETVALRSQLRTLQAEYDVLLTQREQAYDLDAIEKQLIASGEMVKPQSSQVTYLSASQPDSVVRFEKPKQSLRDTLYEKLREFSAGLFS